MTQVVSSQPTKDGNGAAPVTRAENRPVREIPEETCLSFCCALFICEDYHPPKPKKPDAKTAASTADDTWIAMCKAATEKK